MNHYEVVTTSSPSGPHWDIVYVADGGLATYTHLASGPKEMRTIKQHTYECIDSGQWKAETSEMLLVAFGLALYEGKQAISAQALSNRNICEGGAESVERHDLRAQSEQGRAAHMPL
ncbi:hypothetical protein DL766_008306 [Monosporascus sp. MC13-8B]|uniref:Uncharacterized protein n=1 Tax=Monosporascus cannonballus TaxID=155416 RepID=A0ABY0GY40_9PEZI|nr:hypothetical protein DL762_007847 [Monosporascus cannonballus]RYO82389.1 hypothetical protein DL763_008240 [Monosporascus cannonballus]RYP19952.1 hypothetical protein DL766_008306 [Monosporascus sp. MC13-8B]